MKIKKKVMVFGTFDGLHQGHLNLFKQARDIFPNTYLVVSVARDKNVFKIKGVRTLMKEKGRMKLIRATGLVDKVVLSGISNHIPHILKEKPDAIALGYDQTHYVKNLKQDLKKKGLEVEIFRMKPYKKHIYKNHLLKKKARL